MIRFLPFALEVVLLVYCLVDCVQTDSALVRTLPKPLWVLLILVVPLVGGIAWLLAGRPEGRPGDAPGQGGSRPAAPRGPDDDPDFLRRMGPRGPRGPGDPGKS
jgi:hypothetical protein